MSAVGREAPADPVSRLITAVERLADANEEIVKLAKADDGPVLEMAPSPPFCPHCGEFNPMITCNSGGNGRIAEYVVVARCGVCQGTFYGKPEGWSMFESLQAVNDHMKGGNDNGS